MIRVSSSLLSNENMIDIMEYSNNYIYEVGAGSGYNAFLLKLNGANIYCSDCPENQYPIKFVDVEDQVNEEKMKEVIENNGAILYSCPVDEYYNIDLWHSLGGKKVITIADYRKEKNRDGSYGKNRLCPLFNDKRYKLVKTMSVPHFLPEQMDKLRMFTLKE